METISLETTKQSLKELRRASRRKISSSLRDYWRSLFDETLGATEKAVMTECYINGKSYAEAGCKFFYSERQIKRIVASSADKINNYLNKVREL